MRVNPDILEINHYMSPIHQKKNRTPLHAKSKKNL